MAIAFSKLERKEWEWETIKEVLGVLSAPTSPRKINQDQGVHTTRKLGLGKLKNVTEIGFKIFQEFSYHISYIGSMNFHKLILNKNTYLDWSFLARSLNFDSSYCSSCFFSNNMNTNFQASIPLNLFVFCLGSNSLGVWAPILMRAWDLGLLLWSSTKSWLKILFFLPFPLCLTLSLFLSLTF